jgi:hypothetical protein
MEVSIKQGRDKGLHSNEGTMERFKHKRWFVIHVFLAVALLYACGAVYRHYAPQWRGTGLDPVRLPVPLEQFPKEIRGWKGQDLPIATTTQQYMRQHFADDYLSRRYANLNIQSWADVYVVYCSSRPVGILGHKPSVCYPAHGWIPDETVPSEIVTRRGRKVPCLIHRLHKPAPNYAEVVVLSFYVVNGQLATDQKAFSGLMGRNPNISGDPAKYVAQVQISSVLENPIRSAARDMVDYILDILPNPQGVVRAQFE